MGDRAGELRAILANVRARWSRRAFLRAWSIGAWAAAGMLMVGLLAVLLIAQEGIPLVFVVAIVGIFAGSALALAVLPLRQPPSDRQIARFIEEQAGGLDEVVVTAVDKLESGPGPVVDLIVGDAVRAARTVDPHRIVTNDTMSRALAGAAVGSAAFLIAFYFFAPSAERAIDVAGSYLLPELLHHRDRARVRQGAGGPARHHHGTHSRHQRRTCSDHYRRKRRRGAFGAHDHRREGRTSSRSR